MCAGVPREKRGEIWLLLVEQHRLHHDIATEAEKTEVSEKYEDLLKRLTLHQHAILIDLGPSAAVPSDMLYSHYVGARRHFQLTFCTLHIVWPGCVLVKSLSL